MYRVLPKGKQGGERREGLPASSPVGGVGGAGRPVGPRGPDRREMCVGRGSAQGRSGVRGSWELAGDGN